MEPQAHPQAHPQIVGNLEYRAVASTAAKAASLELIRQLSQIDTYDFMRRVGAYLTVHDFKPNGYAVECVFEYDDKIAQAIGRRHRVKVRLKITAESLLHKE